jgi:hypothetical protein
MAVFDQLSFFKKQMVATWMYHRQANILNHVLQDETRQRTK